MRDRRVGQPLVIAHRGASGELPGNTMEAFERAIALGADMIEFDVRCTADDRLIVFHDAEVAGWPVGRLTRQEIHVGTGHLPPLLEEVLGLTCGRVGIDVEIKEAGITARVVSAVLAAGQPEATVLSSFLDRVVFDLAELAPGFERGLIVGRRPPATGRRRSPVERAVALGASHLMLQRGLARGSVLDQAAGAGLAVFIWTVDDRRSLVAYLNDPRVHGVVTDLPELALRVRREVS
ncbi:MAG: glycerophosphodiester phosphodiesterase [Candidatus Dormibacteria bacterium]